MNGDWARLSAAVRAARRGIGLSQMELAEQAGVKRTVVQTIERGHEFRRITGTLLGIERALDWGPGSVRNILDGGDPLRSDANGEPRTSRRSRVGGDLSFRVASRLSQGTILDTAIVPLTPHADVVVVVQGRAGATREELLAALRAWEKREGHLGQLGHGTREKGAPPAV